MKYASKIRLESKTCPGVIVTLGRLTVGRRIKLEQRLASIQDRLAALNRELEKHRAELPDVPVDPSLQTETEASLIASLMAPDSPLAKASGAIMAMNQIVMAERNPIVLDWGVLEVEGLEIDGYAGPFSGKMLFDNAPEELVYEILDVLNRELGLTPDDSKNSESPSTSGAVAGGNPTDTTA